MIIFQLIQKPQKRGAEIFAAQLSGKLQELGHKVVLISLFEGVSDLPFSGEILYLNRPIKNRLFDVKGWSQLAHLVSKYNPDIVQCNAGDTLKWAILSKTLFGWKSVIVARNASMVSSYVKSIFSKKWNEILYLKTDYIISVSEHSKMDLIQLYPFVKNKIEAIPIGIEQQKINEEVYEIQDNKLKHIIHVGGFTFEKNHIGILNIWEKLLKKRSDIALHLIGDGPLKEQIKSIVHEKDLSNIFFHGWINNPLDYISKSDVLILPSTIEGLPAVILEAMYVKTPVIAYNVGGISEIINHNITGFLINDFNEEQFVKSICEVLDSNIENIKKEAYELVHTSFLNNEIAKKFELKYQSIKK